MDAGVSVVHYRKAQITRKSVFLGFHFSYSIVQMLQSLFNLRHKKLAGLGETQMVLAPVKQLYPQLGFQA